MPDTVLSKSGDPAPAGDFNAQMADLKGEVTRLRGRVAERATAWLHAGQEAAGQSIDRVRGAEGEMEDAVRRNPVTAVLTAAGIGFVIGLLVSPRR